MYLNNSIALWISDLLNLKISDIIDEKKQPRKELKKVIGILGDNEFAKKGLPYYISAAGLSILIYQEMASLDNPSNPKCSTYAETLTKNINDYLTEAEITANQVKAQIDTNKKNHLKKINMKSEANPIGDKYFEFLRYFYDGYMIPSQNGEIF